MTRDATTTAKAFTTEGLAGVRAGLEQAVASGAVPGLVALLDRGGETEVVTAGTTSLDGPHVRRDTLFRIASMTKLVTAVAVMMLVEYGKLRLDEPVDRRCPSWRTDACCAASGPSLTIPCRRRARSRCAIC